MSPQGETEVVLEKPKRAPRKRAPKADSSRDAAVAPINRAPRKSAAKKLVEDPSSTRPSARKAPTPIAAQKEKTKRGRKNATVVALLLLLGVGSSAAIGFTDKGQIDVAQTIAKRNEEAKAAGQPEIIIPVQTTLEPNGGLLGVGDDPNAQPQASSTQPTATSTEATASSTEESTSSEVASTSESAVQ